jgi:large conductance mechanosensitive channel
MGGILPARGRIAIGADPKIAPEGFPGRAWGRIRVAQSECSGMAEIVRGFREFVLKADLVAAAVGLVMALATYALVSALVEDLILPIVAAIFGEPSFAGLSFTINDSEFRYGAFLTAAINFAAVAAAVYFFVALPYRAYQSQRGVPATTRTCPECVSTISAAARRCPNCTAPLAPELG